jgi:hypothetical protein
MGFFSPKDIGPGYPVEDVPDRRLTKWKPAKKDGEPVPIAYICPVVFTIKD